MGSATVSFASLTTHQPEIGLALKHYARIKDEDFDAVIGGAKNGASNTISNALNPDATKAELHLGVTQNAAQYPTEIDGTISQQQSQVPIKTASCELTQEAANEKMTHWDRSRPPG